MSSRCARSFWLRLSRRRRARTLAPNRAGFDSPSGFPIVLIFPGTVLFVHFTTFTTLRRVVDFTLQTAQIWVPYNIDGQGASTQSVGEALMNALPSLSFRVDLRARPRPGHERVLTAEALRFVADLARRFEGPILDLLALRRIRQARFNRGERPSFLAETRDVRAARWTIAPVPDDLRDRRVEITGPADRKTIIDAMNSGANVFMADFEDASTPTWDNLVSGQANLMDAVRRTIRFVAPESRKVHELGPAPATLFVRPRGLHLPEKHLVLDGRPAPGALVDFGLYLFHNAEALMRAGTGPYFYLPKLESHLEARLWNDVFLYSEEVLGLPPGTIKATVLVETLPAVFEMDE